MATVNIARCSTHETCHIYRVRGRHRKACFDTSVFYWKRLAHQV